MYGKTTNGKKKVSTKVGKKKQIVENNRGKTVKVKGLKRIAPPTISADATTFSGSPHRFNDLNVTTHQPYSVNYPIAELVRQEVAKAMFKHSFETGAALEGRREMPLAGNLVNLAKLDDLKDIVNKLMVESVIENNAKKVQETAEKILAFEENLKNLTVRISALEQSVNGLAKDSAAFQRTEKKTGLTGKSSIILNRVPRLSDDSKLRLPSWQQNNTEKYDDKEKSELDMNSELSSSKTEQEGEKTRAYNELISKFNRKTLEKQAIPRPSSSLVGKDLADRRLFETNILQWQKSPMTLQHHFSNELFVPQSSAKDTIATEPPTTQSHRRIPIHPRLTKQDTPTSTDDLDSNWLFEQ